MANDGIAVLKAFQHSVEEKQRQKLGNLVKTKILSVSDISGTIFNTLTIPSSCTLGSHELSLRPIPDSC